MHELSLSPSEIQQHRRTLEEWQTAADMIAYVDHVPAGLSSDKLFNHPDLKFLREAEVAGGFARESGADRVRLGKERDRFPDAEICVRQTRRRIEITTAHECDRELGREYRQMKQPIEVEHVRDWSSLEMSLEVPRALSRVVSDKVKKGYSEKVELVIYLNIGAQEELGESFKLATEQARSSFSHVWVLWGNARLIQVWS
jgi:hypothetical protein